jgi:hypothetical protein
MSDGKPKLRGTAEIRSQPGWRILSKPPAQARLLIRQPLDSITASRIANMKELRLPSPGRRKELGL